MTNQWRRTRRGVLAIGVFSVSVACGAAVSAAKCGATDTCTEGTFSGAVPCFLPLQEGDTTVGARMKEAIKKGLIPLGGLKYVSADGKVYSIEEINQETGDVYLISPEDKENKVVIDLETFCSEAHPLMFGDATTISLHDKSPASFILVPKN